MAKRLIRVVVYLCVYIAFNAAAGDNVTDWIVSNKFHVIGACRNVNFVSVEMGHGTTLEAAKKALSLNCSQRSNWGGGTSVEHISVCPDGYYATTNEHAFCGARSLKDAIIGLSRNIQKNSTTEEKNRGVDEVLGEGIDLGLLTTKGPHLFCGTVGASPSGNTFDRDLRYGTGQAYCSSWDGQTSIEVCRPLPGIKSNCMSWIRENFRDR